MPKLPRALRIAGLAAIAAGAGTLLGVAGWFDEYRPVEFSAAIAAAILVSGFARRRRIAEAWGAMAPSFVVDFASALIFGPAPAALVAGCGAVVKGRLAGSPRLDTTAEICSNGAPVVAAIAAAGFAHRALGGTLGHFSWPSQAVPIAAAVLAYSVVKETLAQVVVPLLARQPINRAWIPTVFRLGPMYVVGAGVAVGIVEALRLGAWDILAVAAVPLYFAYHTYSDYVSRLEQEHRSREVVASVDHGMSVVDYDGRVTLWDDAVACLVE